MPHSALVITGDALDLFLRAQEHGNTLVQRFGLDIENALTAVGGGAASLLGHRHVLDQPSVAMVGARNASALGLRIARALARDLGAGGRVIVSGLARGIDGAAHEAALETGTVAVLAGGVDVIYPRENAGLYDRIREAGAILSEAPIGLRPLAKHFPRRNRIVSGLCEAVLLIEAAARSGSRITARFGLEQGREVMAVPGSPLDPRAEGCNELIRQGAALIRGAADVEEALAAPRARPQRPAQGRRSAPPLPAEAQAEASPEPVVTGGDLAARAEAMIGPEAVDVDSLARELGANAASLAVILQEMELDGAIERRVGGLIARAPARGG